MDKDQIFRIIQTREKLYQLPSSDKRRAGLCYDIYKWLRELNDTKMVDWLQKMINHYEIGLNELMFEGKWIDLGAFDRILEAGIVLHDKTILNQLIDWTEEFLPYNNRFNSGDKKRMIERAILCNQPEVALELLTDFDLTRGNVDSYSKIVFNNAPLIYHAILERDKEKFESEIEEMKKRWKRTKEGRKFKYCSLEVIYRGLFDIYMSH